MKIAISMLVLVCAIFFTVPLFAADPLEVAPGIYKRLFENDQVRVLELTAKSGDKIPEHSHPNHFVYAMSDATLEITKEGVAQVVETKKGQVLWLNAETHSTVNIGPTEFHGLVVELKEKG